MSLYFIKTCNGWPIKREKCASPSYIKSIIYFTQSNARHHELYLQNGYWVLPTSSFVWSRNKSDIATACSFIFHISDTSTCTRMGLVSSADGSSEEIKWTIFFFLSKSLMLFIKRTSKFKLHVFLVYEKSLNKNPDLFLKIFIIVLKITKTHHSFSLLSTYSGISNFNELDWTGLLISFHSALHNYGCLDGFFFCCCYIHI